MQLKILTLNCWLMPFLASKDNSERRERIAEFILREKPDFAALQEVWLSRDINFFRKMLDEYLLCHASGTFANKPGLLTLSRLPHWKKSFAAFRKSKAMNIKERLASKGMLISTYQLEKLKLTIINTHLFFPEKTAKDFIVFQQLFTRQNLLANENISCPCGDLIHQLVRYGGVNIQHRYSIP